ncbi:cellulase family glycosylhydrolase [Streptomyces sp. NPDC048550]|uniref:cellulase family glycosylhydrolase n=1 Tax=Streptomyces sp. NPDC048550 TaxID=3155739 RepID=UPI00343A4F88
MRLTSRVAPVALAVAALLFGVLPAQAQARPGRVPDRVTVGDRTFITDGQGRALQWRGFNLSDKSSRGADAFADIHESDLADMSARGFNLARLAVFWDDLEPTSGHYDRGYLAKMRRILDWAERYDIKVILDAHQDVYGPHFGSRGVPDWATRDEGLPFTPIPDDWFSQYFEPSVQTAFDHLYKDSDLRSAHARMWMTVASALGRHPALLGYDLMNEPFAKFLEGEDLPAAAARFEATELTELWNRLARAIRLVDRTSWVFVEPTVIVGLGVPTRMGRIDDPHAGYAPHFYETAMETGADYDPNGTFIPAYEAAISDYPTRNRMPVIVGEWGGNPYVPHGSQFVTDMTASLDRFSSGWTWWQWCRGGGYCFLDQTGAVKPGARLLVQPYARAVAGDPLVFAYAPVTRTYTLTFRTRDDAVGATQIIVPKEAYPSGYRVDVRGDRASWDSHGQTVSVRTRAGAGARYEVTISPR